MLVHVSLAARWRQCLLSAATSCLPVLLAGGSAAGQSLAPQTRHSTHDFTVPTQEFNFHEWGADVKTPGNGFNYSVFTVEVVDVGPTTLFSGASVSAPSVSHWFTRTSFPPKQVALVQVTDAAQGIGPQAFFYGTDALGSANNTVPTNARGISVHPVANDDGTPNLDDTRIAICGESYDQVLPQSQPGAVWTGGPTRAAGFIAVYDGNLTLLWTHHLYGISENFDCAVTDVSIRVENTVDPPGERDVITYCGISSHGNPPGGNAFLTPIQPFAPPPTPCTNSAGGATDNGPGQWDGFIGRISRDHAAVTATVTEFHSVVGGNQQDGLFGIAELPDKRIVVVGSTAGGRTPIPGPLPGRTSAFPLIHSLGSGFCLSSAPSTSTGTDYCLGTLALFDAGATPGGLLVLDDSRAIGTIGEHSTIARDVLGQAHTNLATSGFQPSNTIFVVGSTDDPGLLAGLPNPSVGTFSGVRDGFVLALAEWRIPGFPHALRPLYGEYRSGPGASGECGLTGINAWNEFSDQGVVTGFIQLDQGAPRDIDVASYYLYGASYESQFPAPAFPVSMRLLTGGQIVGDLDDHPTAMGIFKVTDGSGGSGSLPFETFLLGDPAGGGVAQDQRGRVNVVGATNSPNYPVVGAPTARPRSLAFPGPTPNHGMYDGVRTVLDLLPAGVGRTDGTGQTPSPTLTYPRPGTDGGTTTPCPLAKFGKLGFATPPLLRMLIDYEGPTPGPGVTTAAIVVVRPPASTGSMAAALQFGFPGNPGSTPVPYMPMILPSGVEVWTVLPPPSTTFFVFTPASNDSFRFRLGPMPPSPLTFTAQLFCVLTTSHTAGNPAAGMPCVGSTSESASPALWISY